jgi:hypothetical protein
MDKTMVSGTIDGSSILPGATKRLLKQYPYKKPSTDTLLTQNFKHLKKQRMRKKMF